MTSTVNRKGPSRSFSPRLLTTANAAIRSADHPSHRQHHNRNKCQRITSFWVSPHRTTLFSLVLYVGLRKTVGSPVVQRASSLCKGGVEIFSIAVTKHQSPARRHFFLLDRTKNKTNSLCHSNAVDCLEKDFRQNDGISFRRRLPPPTRPLNNEIFAPTRLVYCCIFWPPRPWGRGEAYLTLVLFPRCVGRRRRRHVAILSIWWSRSSKQPEQPPMPHEPTCSQQPAANRITWRQPTEKIRD